VDPGVEASHDLLLVQPRRRAQVDDVDLVGRRRIGAARRSSSEPTPGIAQSASPFARFASSSSASTVADAPLDLPPRQQVALADPHADDAHPQLADVGAATDDPMPESCQAGEVDAGSVRPGLGSSVCGTDVTRSSRRCSVEEGVQRRIRLIEGLLTGRRRRADGC
jgi:hypothetical protein